MNKWIAAQATAQAINMLHQKYIVKQMNVCRGCNGSRGEQKRNGKCGVGAAAYF